MSEQLSPAERYDLATKLITQSPPGQVNDVIAGNIAIQIIVDDNSDEFKEQVMFRLREYHRAQLQSVTLDGAASPSLISEAAALNSELDRYIDPQSKQSFKLDHFTLETSDVQKHEILPEYEAFRSELQTSLASYIADHYPTSDSIGTVFCSAQPIGGKKKNAKKTGVVPAVEQREGVAVRSQDPTAREKGTVGDATTTETAVDEVPPPAAADAPEAETSKTDEPAASSTTDQDATPITSNPEPASEFTVKDSSTGILSAAQGVVSDTVQAVESTVSDTVQVAKEALSADVPVAAVETREVGSIADEVPTADTVEAKEENATEDVTTEATGPRVLAAYEAEAVEGEEEEEEEEDVVQEDPTFTVCIVGNKYNTNNFWTGRWRSIWTIDMKAEKLHGDVHVDVHYFEAGNVQLSTSQAFDLSLPPNNTDQAGKIVSGISKLEAEYQLKLAETNQQFGEKEFRSLRRALPITRTRMDWDKVSAYRLRQKA